MASPKLASGALPQWLVQTGALDGHREVQISLAWLGLPPHSSDLYLCFCGGCIVMRRHVFWRSFAVGGLILSATLGAALVHAPPATDELLASATQAYDQCRARMKDATSSGPGKAVLAGPGTICFAGAISRQSMDLLLDVFAKVPKGTPILFAAASSGGHVSAALDVAEQITSRNVTFVVGSVCASSCANYFFLPAARRVIMKDALVIFHGGMSPGYIAGVENQFSAEKKKWPADQAKIAQLAAVVATAHQSARRQEAMLRAIKANPRFFDLFDSFSFLPGSKFRKDCRTSLKAREFVLSDRVLQTNGVKVHANYGPQTSVALDAVLKRRDAAGQVCFWS